MIDGHLRRVVKFPDDGRQDLAANPLDLTRMRGLKSCCRIRSESGSIHRTGHTPQGLFTSPFAIRTLTNRVIGRTLTAGLGGGRKAPQAR